MFKIGLPELIVIFIAVILLFGVNALPEFAKALAKAIQGFRRAMRGMGEESPPSKQNDMTKNKE